jgi:anti-anti-sigma factor
MGSEQYLTTRIDSRNGVTRIALAGEVDMATVPVLKQQLAQAEQDGAASIMVDLRDVTFIDSQGLHALLRARERAQSNGHRLLIVGASPSARRLFQITGKEFLIDEQEAVSVLRRFTGIEIVRPVFAEASHEASDV